MAVSVTTSPVFEAGEPRPLFQQPPGTIASATDGERLLLAVSVGQTTQSPFTIVLNWQGELRARVPAK